MLLFAVMKTALVLAGALVLPLAPSPAQEDTVKTLMRAKTGYAHRLLDAIVQEDFEVVRDQAFRLKAVAGTADWKVIDTEEYVRESDAFIRATERLESAAKERNGDGAALAYLDVTLTCVHCHRYVRETRGVP
jgi:hypothetical protein